jgi:hypothetical protein
MGAGVLTVGLVIVLLGLGVIPSPPESVHAPRWVLTCAGLVFVLGGAAVINGRALMDAPAPYNQVIQNVFGIGIVVLLLAISGWVAFGPGERHFTSSSSFSAASPVNERSGRVAFGIGFFFVLALFILGTIYKLKPKGR